jgi:hypothetical protein
MGDDPISQKNANFPKPEERLKYCIKYGYLDPEKNPQVL